MPFDLEGLKSSLFTQAPHWLRVGLRAEDPNVPNRILSDFVLPTIDIGSAAGYSGEGDVQLNAHDNTYVANTAITLIDNASTDALRRQAASVYAIRVFASAAAAPA